MRLALLLSAAITVAGVSAGSERAGFGAIAKRHSPASEELLDLRGAGVPGFSNVSVRRAGVVYAGADIRPVRAHPPTPAAGR